VSNISLLWSPSSQTGDGENMEDGKIIRVYTGAKTQLVSYLEVRVYVCPLLVASRPLV
jgi:hypothetical protein